VSDAISQMSSIGLIIMCVVGFLVPAIAGITMISRLGGAGWFMYVLVLGTWSLVFGPVIASAVTIHQNGSKRHRDAKRERIEQQRRKFGLHARHQETQTTSPPGEADDDRWGSGQSL
jgi:hypothetical protein